jgi:hypothetical protein
VLSGLGYEDLGSIPVVIDGVFLLLFVVQMLILKFIFKNRLRINIFVVVIFLIAPLIFCYDDVQYIPYCELIAILKICAVKLIFDFERLVGLFHKKQN